MYYKRYNITFTCRRITRRYTVENITAEELIGIMGVDLDVCKILSR